MKKLLLSIIFSYICCIAIAQTNSHLHTNTPHEHTETGISPNSASSLEAQAQGLHQETAENLVYKFLENKNQWDTNIKYRATIPSGMLSLKNNSLIYSFYDSKPLLNRHRKISQDDSLNSKSNQNNNSPNDKLKAHGVEVKFLGANPNPTFQTTGQGTEAYNFFLGNSAAKWASNVKSYTGLSYKNLYNGVDMRFYSTEDVLKYEFIVAPNIDTKQIKLEYFGANKVELENGNLKVSTSVLDFIEQHPYCYQEIEGKKVEVPANFVLENNVLSYDFPEGYNQKYPLIIDPTLIFSTYSGSISDNWGYTATFDNAGNLYSGGIVSGQQLPVTVGAFDITFGGIWDTAILKYNPTGTNALYITFLGGVNSDCPNSMIVNNAGNLVIMGSTGSPDFPTSTNAFDRSFNGGNMVNFDGINYPLGSDIFIMILNSTGTAMVNATFVGGSGNDGLAVTGSVLIQNYGDEFRGEVNIDAADNIYVATGTTSANFPNTNATIVRGLQDGVVFRMNPALSSMTWGTYVGGSQEDIAYNVKVATNGDIFICGATTSSNLISTAGTLQVAYNGGMDGFVQRYNAAGVLQSGTYIGTTSYDATYFMDIDANNDVFVFGNTTGVHPISQGVYSNIGSGHFVYKLNNTLTTRIWSTQIGAVNSGTPSITPTAFMVNDCGNIYLAGWGGLTSQFSPRRNSTTGLPVTPNAIRGTTTGDDFYLMILGKNATSLLYGTFFGGASSDNVDGDHVDGGTSRFSKNGVIYHAVCACRGNSVPTTAGAWRTTNAGAANNGCNNLAFKIDLDPFLADFVPIDVATNLAVVNGACSPITVRLRNDSRNATVFQWNLGTFGTSTLREPVVNVTQSGTYSFTMTATNPDYCLGPITITKSIRVDGGVLTVSPDVVICKGQSTNLTASGGLTYTWSPTTGLSNPNIANPIASPTQTTTYTLTSQVSQNCRQQKTVTVTVSESIEPKFIFTLSDLCATFPLVTISNQSNTGGSYTWDFGNGRTFVGQTPTPFRYTTEGTFNIKLTTNAGSSCPLDLTKSITIQKNNNVIIPTISPNVKLCEGDKTQLLATGGTIYSWTPATGLSNTNIPNPIATAIRSTTYTVRISNNQGCFRDTSLVLSVSPPVTPKFTAKLTNDCELFPLVTLTNQSVGALTYLWNFGNGQTSTEENPKPFRYTKAGTYRIILSVRNTDCSRNDTLNLKIDENSDNEFIKFIELAADQNICVGDTVRLAATTGAIIGTTYAWTPTTGLNNANIANPIAIPTQTTRYTARITNKLGCFKDTSILVNVAPKIVLDFDVILEELCEPYPLTRIISRVTGADTYTWTFGNGQTFVGAQPPPYKYTADGNYTISVTGKNANCQKTSSKQSLQTYLVANNFYKQIRVAPRNPSLCLGDKVQLNASGGFRYLWTPATGLSNTTIANPIANPSQSTVYNVRIFNERGCFVDSAVTVAVVPELKVDFELQVSSECGKNGIVKFVNKTTGTGQYKWFLGDGRALTTENPADNSYEKSGEYEVILEVFNGVCSRTKSQKIKVENVNPPNVITPNGDGKNERFVIDNVRNGWKVEIYDRWNKQIYKTDNYQNDWGGDVTNALYYYLLTSPEGKTCKGWVLVVKGEN